MTLDGKIAGIVDASQRRAARIAGFMFLFSLLVPLLNWSLGLSKLVVADDVMATASNIVSNEMLFRVGITVELIMSVGLVVLALALYVVLKPVNKNLALLALFWKLVEATIVAVIVFVSFIALQLLKGEGYFTPEQLQVPVGFLLNEHTVLYSIPMVFLGLDLTLFFYLFFKSRYIPRIFAAFGVLSYTLILIHALCNILAPDFASMQIVEIISFTPSCLAELVIGSWLLFKGIDISGTL